MTTVLERVESEASLLSATLSTLLRTRSGLRDMNRRSGGGIVFIGPSFAWHQLDEQGNRARSRLFRDFGNFEAIVQGLVNDQPAAVKKQVKQSLTAIRSVIEQSQLSWFSSIEEAVNGAKKHVAQVLGAVRSLDDASEGSVLLVPDTNALLFNPDLAKWIIPEFPRFTLVLVPAVLSELDHLKINHHNQVVRRKSEGLIRRIKEYRRRGSLTDGVLVLKDTISIRALAVEPHVSTALPWLDESSTDDRLLASTFEIMRSHSRSVVVLVTRDINLQNKAEFAHIAFCEPPGDVTCEDN
jgi:PIN domain